MRYSIPWIELSERKLKKRKRTGQVTPEMYDRIRFWKEELSIVDSDDLEYKYFLENIDVIKTRLVAESDMHVTLFGSLKILDIIGERNARIQMSYLSQLGYLLTSFLESGKYDLYESCLFWLLIRSDKFKPIIQVLLSDPRFYIDEYKEERIISRDGISRALAKKWLNYFGLLKSGKPDYDKISILLLYATVFEINQTLKHYGSWKVYVEEACENLSQAFSISQSTIDYGVFLDIIYERSNGGVKGYPSGRGHSTLPSKREIQILSFQRKISFEGLSGLDFVLLRHAIRFQKT